MAGSHSEFLRIQEEIAALEAIYGEEDQFQVVQEPRAASDPVAVLRVGFSVGSASASVSIQLPRGYPDAAYARLAVQSTDLPNRDCDELAQRAQRVAEDAFGCEACFLAIEGIREDLCEALASCEQSASGSSPMPESCAALLATESDKTCVRRLFFRFHHIKSTKKRRLIQQWTSELDLTGVCRIGCPSVIIAEGDADAAGDLARRLRGLAWQAITLVRDDLDSLNRFDSFTELSCSMGELHAVCVSHGLGDELADTVRMPLTSTAEPPDVSSDDDEFPPQKGITVIHLAHMRAPSPYVKKLAAIARRCHVSVVVVPGAVVDGSYVHVVALVGGDLARVQRAVRQWREQRMDIDAHGKPCLERLLRVTGRSVLSSFEYPRDPLPECVRSLQPALPRGDAPLSCADRAYLTTDELRVVHGDEWKALVQPGDALSELEPLVRERRR